MAENPDSKHRDLPVQIYAALFACKFSPEVSEDNYEQAEDEVNDQRLTRKPKQTRNHIVDTVVMSNDHQNPQTPSLKQSYDLPSSIATLRSLRQASYNTWVSSQAPKNVQDPSNVNVQYDNGMGYDENAMVLEPTQVRDICIHAGVDTVDAEYVTDLTHVNMIHCGCALATVFTWADELINRPELVHGKVTWLMPNVSTKREDSLITPNAIQWSNFIKRAMQTATEPTVIIFGQPLPYTTVDPQMNVRLDRRMSQLMTRKWLTKVIYQGGPQFYAYDALSSSSTYGKMIPIKANKSEPYAFYVFNSKASYTEYEFIHVNAEQTTYDVMSNKVPLHCRIDANPSICCSSNQLIKLMNGQPSDMQSSVLQKMDLAKKLPLSPSDVSKRIAKPTTTTPFKWWVVDFTTTMEEY